MHRANCFKCPVIEIDNISFILPFQKLRAMHGIAIMKDEGRGIYFYDVQIVFQTKPTGNQKQQLVMIMDMAGRQTVAARRQMKYGLPIVCDNIWMYHIILLS